MDRDRADWFERIYGDAEAAGTRVPWDRGAPHRHLVAWAERERLDGREHRAVVVGCGTGDDAAFVASLGFATTAFDIAPTAIALAQDRFPDAGVTWAVADLFALPADWRGSFDFVVENQTAQALPATMRPDAIAAIANLVAPGGTLLFLANRAAGGEVAGGPPFPLRQDELDHVVASGLVAVSHEALSANGHPRWRVVYRRP